MLEHLGGWIISFIASLGYPGVFLTMAIESALIPLPSEVIMPFSGYLAQSGRFDFFLVVLVGALGNVAGSLIAYALGFYGREKVVRRLVRKFGTWILLTEDEFDEAEKLLHKHKDWIVFGSRVVPGIRTVISLPCGIARLPLARFIILTFVGSLIWSAFLAWVGFVLGQNWQSIGPLFHKLDAAIIALLLVCVGLYVYYKLKKRKKKFPLG